MQWLILWCVNCKSNNFKQHLLGIFFFLLQHLILSFSYCKSSNTYVNFFSFLFAASFYGSGFANLKLQDARSTTDLSLRFRTSRPEALLVLVAGKTDYCLVMLQAGMIKVSLYWTIQLILSIIRSILSICIINQQLNNYLCHANVITGILYTYPKWSLEEVSPLFKLKVLCCSVVQCVFKRTYYKCWKRA